VKSIILQPKTPECLISDLEPGDPFYLPFACDYFILTCDSKEPAGEGQSIICRLNLGRLEEWPVGTPVVPLSPVSGKMQFVERHEKGGAA